MRHSIADASVWLLLFLAAGVPSSAQTARSPNEVAAANQTYSGDMAADPHIEQGFVSDTEQKATAHQAPGFISGTVLDQSGAVSPGAEVRLIHERATSNQQAKSGANGQFLFADVAPGSFRLTITSEGFTTRDFTAALRPGETYLVPPIILSVAPSVTEVHVKVSPLTPAQVADIQIKEQEKQRIFGLIPNFYVSYDRDALPLNPRQKFRLAWKTTSDPFTFVGVGALAGVEQATNAFDEYGQGAQGYFKRFGASYTDAITGTFIGGAVLPSLLKQDPRYFYRGTGSTQSRLWYALSSPLICKGDNMRWQPNYSNVGGAFASAGISYLYYPDATHRGSALLLQNSMIRLGEVAFESVLQEFLIRRLTPHLRNRATDKR
jgi:hypothetical protein